MTGQKGYIDKCHYEYDDFKDYNDNCDDDDCKVKDNYDIILWWHLQAKCFILKISEVCYLNQTNNSHSIFFLSFEY